MSNVSIYGNTVYGNLYVVLKNVYSSFHEWTLSSDKIIIEYDDDNKICGINISSKAVKDDCNEQAKKLKKLIYDFLINFKSKPMHINDVFDSVSEAKEKIEKYKNKYDIFISAKGKTQDVYIARAVNEFFKNNRVKVFWWENNDTNQIGLIDRKIMVGLAVSKYFVGLSFDYELSKQNFNLISNYFSYEINLFKDLSRDSSNSFFKSTSMKKEKKSKEEDKEKGIDILSEIYDCAYTFKKENETLSDIYDLLDENISKSLKFASVDNDKNQEVELDESVEDCGNLIPKYDERLMMFFHSPSGVNYKEIPCLNNNTNILCIEKVNNDDRLREVLNAICDTLSQSHNVEEKETYAKLKLKVEDFVKSYVKKHGVNLGYEVDVRFDEYKDVPNTPNNYIFKYKNSILSGNPDLNYITYHFDNNSIYLVVDDWNENNIFEINKGKLEKPGFIKTGNKYERITIDYKVFDNSTEKETSKLVMRSTGEISKNRVIAENSYYKNGRIKLDSSLGTKSKIMIIGEINYYKENSDNVDSSMCFSLLFIEKKIIKYDYRMNSNSVLFEFDSKVL